MRITMVGTGYVGLVTGTCFANTGNQVTCLDVDPAKIDKLQRGKSPIFEPGLDELIQRNVRAGRLRFTLDKQEAYQSAEAIFICVGTPSDAQGNSDLRYVLEAGRDIGQALEAAPGQTGGPTTERRRKLIVVKSTVPVGTNAKIRDAIVSQTAKAFCMASNPEFLKEGAAIQDFNKPDRVVIGAEESGASKRLVDLYEPFVRNDNPIFVMDIPSAEMVKYAANAMLATKISFINEMAGLCEAYGADVDEVRRGMCADERIGHKFLYPGLGYGGSCFPKDVLACIAMGHQSGREALLMEAVNQVNHAQRLAFVRKIDRHFNSEIPANAVAQNGPGRADVPRSDLSGKTFAFWGIAFKPGTDDIRQAPAITLMQALIERGASVIAYDPAAHQTSHHVLGDQINYADAMYSAIDEADALVICTDWDEFKHPDFDALRTRMNRPLIFDGRNLYKPQAMADAGFTYYSIGR